MRYREDYKADLESSLMARWLQICSCHDTLIIRVLMFLTIPSMVWERHVYQPIVSLFADIFSVEKDNTPLRLATDLYALLWTALLVESYVAAYVIASSHRALSKAEAYWLLGLSVVVSMAIVWWLVHGCCATANEKLIGWILRWSLAIVITALVPLLEWYVLWSTACDSWISWLDRFPMCVLFIVMISAIFTKHDFRSYAYSWSIVLLLLVAAIGFLLWRSSKGDDSILMIGLTALCLVRGYELLSFILGYFMWEQDLSAWPRSLFTTMWHFVEIVIICSVVFLAVSHLAVDDFSTGGKCITSEPENAFYFSLVTIVTLGYGDLAPKTIWGKAAVCAEILCGILLLVLTVQRVLNRKPHEKAYLITKKYWTRLPITDTSCEKKNLAKLMTKVVDGRLDDGPYQLFRDSDNKFVLVKEGDFYLIEMCSQWKSRSKPLSEG